MRIDTIASHLEYVDTIARWHWDEWGHVDPGGSPATWIANLRLFTHRDRIPTTYVALEGDRLLGSVTLNDLDMHTHPELWPWLAGVYVTPSARGKGVASALVTHAVSEARGMGVERLYLYTHSARGLYEKLGWSVIREEIYENHMVTIMSTEP